MPPQQQQPHASVPFWDFIQSLDPNHAPGGGVDHNNPLDQLFSGVFGPQANQNPQGARGPWGGAGADFDWDQGWGPWGGHGHGRRGRHGGPRGRHAHRHHAGMSDDEAPEQHTPGSSDNEKAESPDTMRGEVPVTMPADAPADAPDPAEVAPEDPGHSAPGHGSCRRGPGRGGCGGGGGRGAFRRGGRGGPHHSPGHFHGPPPPYAGGMPFDFAGMMRGVGGHPFFQNLREQAENFRGAPGQNNNTSNNNDHASATDPDAFVPPVDIFNTEGAFVLHVALPGAKKEHIGVNWNPDSSVLNIAGVVHRPGDEEFLRALSSGERKVGVFERNVTLPPAGADKDEVDGDAITAKMEDGVLVVTVPKVEKEWTEIRKVDIE